MRNPIYWLNFISKLQQHNGVNTFILNKWADVGHRSTFNSDKYCPKEKNRCKYIDTILLWVPSRLGYVQLIFSCSSTHLFMVREAFIIYYVFIYYLLFIVYYLLFIIYYLLFIIYYLFMYYFIKVSWLWNIWRLKHLLLCVNSSKKI